MSDNVVFDPDVVVTEQALARKKKFMENKQQGLFDVDPAAFHEILPQLWFDDQGEIVAVSYDINYVPDKSWTTWDFDERSLKKLKVIGTNFYKVERTTLEEGEVSYSIVLKKDQTRRVVHSTQLKHATTKSDSTKVNILVEVNEKSIKLHLTDVGRYLMTNLPEKYNNLGSVNFYITESLNPHFMLKEFSFDPTELIMQDVIFDLKEDYRLKSIYFNGPFVYGRV